jgi:hypothetical protein
MDSPPIPATRSRYPLGVLVVVVMSAFRCVTIAVGLVRPEADSPILTWLLSSTPLPDFRPGSDIAIVGTGVLVGLFIASLLAVVGLLARRRWAWVLAIVTAGFILALDLGWWWAGEPRYGSMLVNVIAVFYLNQQDVRISLRGARVDP